MMRTVSPALTAFAIVALSCLGWTAAISGGLVHFIDLPTEVGWVVAGLMVISATLALIIVLYEMRHATELTDYL